MSAPVISTLRARPGIVRLATDGAMGDTIMLRAQVPEVWDAVRIEAPKSATVMEVKRFALRALVPDETDVQGFVVKLRGHEVLDERVSLEDAGVRQGSTLLITNRRRRPVK